MVAKDWRDAANLVAQGIQISSGCPIHEHSTSDFLWIHLNKKQSFPTMWFLLGELVYREGGTFWKTFSASLD